MKNELVKAFTNDKFGNVRVVLVGSDQKPYFVGKDVATSLGYKDTVNALKQHCRGVVKHHVTDSIGRKQEVSVIPEGDLYRLITHSKLSQAEQFEAWVFDEVLPTIRKHGAYATDDVINRVLSNPDFGIELLTKLKMEREENEKLQIENTQHKQIIGELKPKADYTDSILQNKSLMPIKSIAKDYGMSSQEMNNKLHDLKVQYKEGDQWFLYSKYHSKGYTHSETREITHKCGMTTVKLHTKWTQKGRLFIYELLKKNGVIPMIERD